jgi:hypothetical protein
MSTREYYINEYGLDINLLPYDLGNAIASNFIENLIVPKEEMIEKFKMYNAYQPKPQKRNLFNQITKISRAAAAVY